MIVVADWQRIAWSLVGAVALNLTLAVNHKPGRYRDVGSGWAACASAGIGAHSRP